MIAALRTIVKNSFHFRFGFRYFYVILQPFLKITG